jgi:hypothetical protein
VEQFFYYDANAYTGAEEETFYSKLSETQEAQFHERHCIYEYHNLQKLVEELHQMNFFKSSTAQEVQAAETRLPASLGRDSGPSLYQSQSKARGDIQRKLGDHVASRKESGFELVGREVEISLEHLQAKT